MSEPRREPRVVLVTGATSGIGLATALRFAGLGDRVVLAARSEQALDGAAARCRSAGAASVDVHAVDVSVREDVEALVRRTVDAHGRVDVAVLNAAVMAYGTVETLPPEVFEQVVRTLVFGTQYCLRALLPQLRAQGGGTVVVVNSLLGSVTVPQMGAYATAKWGQRALVRTVQQELRDEPGIDVCLVSPGSINTPIYYQAGNYLGREVRPPWPVLSPERTARQIERLARRPRANLSVPVGPANPLIIAGFRLLPFVYDRIVGAAFRLAAVTDRRADPSPGYVHKPRPDLERLHGRWPDRAS